jgi:large repetitive protein
VIVVVKEPPPPPPPAEQEYELMVSRIITPDGDGKNDHWQIDNIEHFPDNRIIVVDRWGSTVFTAAKYDNEQVVWRGNSKSAGKLPAGTYFYVINFTRQGIPAELRGFIELIP